MESNEPARRPAPPASRASEAERPKDDKAQKEQTDKEIAERVSSPPEQPTPTQAEADALKSGEALVGADGQRRDVRPGAPAAGYQTR